MGRFGGAPLAFCFLVLGCSVAAHGQRPAYYFAELGGAGGLASINLEVNPAGPVRARIGAGLFFFPSIPATVAVTLGSRHHALELGAGGTLVIVPAKGSDRHTDPFDWGDPDGTILIGTGVVGYRYTPDSGFLFRATLTPLYDTRRAILWLGLSVGKRF